MANALATSSIDHIKNKATKVARDETTVKGVTALSS